MLRKSVVWPLPSCPLVGTFFLGLCRTMTGSNSSTANMSSSSSTSLSPTKYFSVVDVVVDVVVVGVVVVGVDHLGFHGGRVGWSFGETLSEQSWRSQSAIFDLIQERIKNKLLFTRSIIYTRKYLKQLVSRHFIPREAEM